jgi:DNA-binding transcriptional LysR family regulator
MDFDQLETFLEVARTLSFSRAAERRFRTQPAISAQIRALEEEVGARLFDRSGGRVALTGAGKAFQGYAEDSINSRRSMMTNLAEMERVPRGELVVAANEGTCLHVLPEVFAEFKRQYPKVAVSIMRSEHAKVLESVIDNSVDFGVVTMPMADKRLEAIAIHRDELALIVPPHHPLALMTQRGKQSAIPTLGDVAQYPLVMPKLGRTRDALEALFHQRGLKLSIAMELDSSELLKRFVAANVGVGFIARSHVADDVRAGVLAAITMPDVQVRRDLALVYRKDKALGRAALAFIEVTARLKSQQLKAAESR